MLCPQLTIDAHYFHCSLMHTLHAYKYIYIFTYIVITNVPIEIFLSNVLSHPYFSVEALSENRTHKYIYAPHMRIYISFDHYGYRSNLFQVKYLLNTVPHNNPVENIELARKGLVQN